MKGCFIKEKYMERGKCTTNQVTSIEDTSEMERSMVKEGKSWINERYEFKNSSVFDGNFENDQINGYGEMKYYLGHMYLNYLYM